MDSKVVSLAEFRDRSKPPSAPAMGMPNFIFSEPQAYAIEDLIAFMTESFIREIQSMGYTLHSADGGLLRLIPLADGPKPIQVIVEE